MLSSDAAAAAEEMERAAAEARGDGRWLGCAVGVRQAPLTPRWLTLLVGAVVVLRRARRREQRVAIGVF